MRHLSFRPTKILRPESFLSFERRNWFYFVFELHRNDTFKALGFSMLLVGAYTWLVVWVFEEQLHSLPTVSTALHSILGMTLGLLLVIRTNTAYDRWWEGRKMWGGLVNNSRNLALKVATFLGHQRMDERQDYAALISSYAIALRDHLRGHPSPEALTDLNHETIEELRHAHHLPNRVAAILYENLNDLARDKRLTPEQALMLDTNLNEFTNIAGACERIKKSPMPRAYAQHLKMFILVFVLTLPLGLVREFHYYAIPACMLVFYAMTGLELISEEIEEPFGTDNNDIPLDAICQTIRASVYEVLAPHTLENGK